MVDKNSTQTPKTEPKAAENGAAHTPNPAAMFGKLAEEQLSRVESLFAEVEKAQVKSLEQTTEAIDEAARLMKESFGYANKLGAEWRKLALATSRQTAAMFSAPWSV